ncbi:hypothetical protein [Fusobacterium varium]|uniref:hypothetical protein n=1 Tax=Fusobacterium varium TaxID=856 RepID=UPI00241FB1C6|nr:hypothetical protein [Fusobacterium varium]
MKLSYPNSNEKKVYSIQLEENILGIVEQKKINKTKIKLKYNFEEIIFEPAVEPLKKGDILEKILDSVNEIFKEIKYKINNEGEIIGISNLDAIQEKWHEKRKEILNQNEMEIPREYVTELGRLITDKNKLYSMLKCFNVVPFLFLGVYNQNITKSTPVRKESILYNVFPLENIPIQYEIYDDSSFEEKKIRFIVKETSFFDRSEYIKRVIERCAADEKIRIGSFDFKCDGYYIFDGNNIINKFELKLKIEIKNLITYACNYSIKESKECDG